MYRIARRIDGAVFYAVFYSDSVEWRTDEGEMFATKESAERTIRDCALDLVGAFVL